MSSKKINCRKCETYLGEIEKARIMVGVVYLCPKCHKLLFSTKAKTEANDLPDEFKKIFGL